VLGDQPASSSSPASSSVGNIAEDGDACDDEEEQVETAANDDSPSNTVEEAPQVDVQPEPPIHSNSNFCRDFFKPPLPSRDKLASPLELCGKSAYCFLLIPNLFSYIVALFVIVVQMSLFIYLLDVGFVGGLQFYGLEYAPVCPSRFGEESIHRNHPSPSCQLYYTQGGANTGIAISSAVHSVGIILLLLNILPSILRGLQMTSCSCNICCWIRWGSSCNCWDACRRRGV
jgi:hypothetical protein